METPMANVPLARGSPMGDAADAASYLGQMIAGAIQLGLLDTRPEAWQLEFWPGDAHVVPGIHLVVAGVQGRLYLASEELMAPAAPGWLPGWEQAAPPSPQSTACDETQQNLHS